MIPILVVDQQQKPLGLCLAALELEGDAAMPGGLIPALPGAGQRRLALGRAHGIRQRALRSECGRARQTAALIFKQIDRAARAAGGLDEFLEHLDQHRFDPRIGAQHAADLEHRFHRARNLVHYVVEGFHFAQRRRGPLFAAAEIESRQSQRLRRDPFQCMTHGAADLPAQRQDQRDQRKRYQDHARTAAHQFAQEFVDGRGGQQPHVHAIDPVEGQDRAQPFPSAGLVGNDPAVGGGRCPPQTRQCVDTQVTKQADVEVIRPPLRTSSAPMSR